MEVIGEATKSISQNTRIKNPQVPWREMAGMRDVLIHNYFGVDVKIIWNVVEKELPRIKEYINKLI